MPASVKWLGAAVNRRKDAGLRAGLAAGGEAALAVSNSRVPVATGGLRASGSAEVTSHNGRPSVAISYSAGHAVIVHERMDLAHDDGQAKFLEDTVAEQPHEGSPAVRAVAAGLRRAL